MKALAGRKVDGRRKHAKPEEALAAIRKSKKKYEGSEEGRKRKSRWAKDNREHLNRYKREWRERKAQEATNN